MLIPYLDFTPSVAAPMDCAATAAIVGRTVAGPGGKTRDGQQRVSRPGWLAGILAVTEQASRSIPAADRLDDRVQRRRPPHPLGQDERQRLGVVRHRSRRRVHAA